MVAEYAVTWQLTSGKCWGRPALVLPAALVVGLLTAPAALCGGSQRFTLWPQTKRGLDGEEWAWEEKGVPW